MQGSNIEQQVVNALDKNTTLLKFGMTFETQGPRIKAAQLMVRNNDLGWSCTILCGLCGHLYQGFSTVSAQTNSHHMTIFLSL